MKPIILALLLLGTSLLYAQNSGQNPSVDVLRNGRIVLANGDTLDGRFTINLPNDLLEYKLGNSIKTYSARQVQYFYFQEEEANIIRYFFTLPYSDYGSYKAPHLFELLYLGQKLSLYCRERIVIENVPYYDGFTNRTHFVSRNKLVNDFYFRDNKGLISLFSQTRKNLLSFMKGYEEPIKEHLNNIEMSFSNREDMIKLIDYYNNLIQPHKNDNSKQTPPDTSKQR